MLASGSILSMFDFDHPPIPENRALFLDPTTGQVTGGGSFDGGFGPFDHSW